MRTPLGVYKRVTRSNQSHEANDLLSHNHLQSHNLLLPYERLRRPDAEMDIRDWSSRLKKKFKPRSKKRRPDRPEAESGGERVDSASSLVPPPSHVVTGSSHNQDDDGTNLGVQQARSEDRLPPSDVEQVSVHRCDDDHEGEEGGVDGGEAGQSHSRPHSDARVAVGDGPGQEASRTDEEKVGQGCPSPSIPLIPLSGKSDGST